MFSCGGNGSCHAGKGLGGSPLPLIYENVTQLESYSPDSTHFSAHFTPWAPGPALGYQKSPYSSRPPTDMTAVKRRQKPQALKRSRRGLQSSLINLITGPIGSGTGCRLDVFFPFRPGGKHGFHPGSGGPGPLPAPPQRPCPVPAQCQTPGRQLDGIIPKGGRAAGSSTWRSFSPGRHGPANRGAHGLGPIVHRTISLI